MRRAAVVGGANVDIKGRSAGSYTAGTSNPGHVTISPGGVGRNIAETLSRLGVAVSLVTALGSDANGDLLRRSCAAAAVDLSGAVTAREPTGTYLAVLDDSGEMVSAVSDMRAVDALTTEHLEGARTILSHAEILVADCNLSTACLAWICAFAASNRLPLLIEPVSVPKALRLLQFDRPYPAYAITPNRQQFEALSGGDLMRLHDLGFENAVVHQGRAGALASDGKRVLTVPPPAVQDVMDVTGAGDAAVAGIVLGLLEGMDLARAAWLGQCAAAITLGAYGSVAHGISRAGLYRQAGY